jgi:hypothetical protein
MTAPCLQALSVSESDYFGGNAADNDRAHIEMSSALSTSSLARSFLIDLVPSRRQRTHAAG